MFIVLKHSGQVNTTFFAPDFLISSTLYSMSFSKLVSSPVHIRSCPQHFSSLLTTGTTPALFMILTALSQTSWSLSPSRSLNIAS